MASVEFELLVLCGGRGTRLAGQDKPLLAYAGQPMVEHVARTVPPATSIQISANRNLEHYQRWGQVFTDEQVIADYAAASPTRLLTNQVGPLLGILGGLARCELPWLLVSPGDTPHLGPHWYQPLLEQRNNAGAVIFDGTRQQHLHLLLATHLAPKLHDYLARGQHRVWQWIEEVGLSVATCEQPDWFTNINTLKDLTQNPD